MKVRHIKTFTITKFYLLQGMLLRGSSWFCATVKEEVPLSSLCSTDLVRSQKDSQQHRGFGCAGSVPCPSH